MSSMAIETDSPLSRITVGSLEDLGYTVNYGGADYFSSSQVSSSCRCNRRLGEKWEEAPERRMTALQQAAKDNASAFGKQILSEIMPAYSLGSYEVGSELAYVGDAYVVVIYRDPYSKGPLSVLVRGDSDV
jgi:hypothetical protein